MAEISITVDRDGNGYTARSGDTEAYSGDVAQAVFRLLIENPDLGIKITVDEDAEYKGRSAS